MADAEHFRLKSG